MGSKPASWMFFIAAIMILIGLYATARTLINIAFFERYPISGVIPVSINAVSPTYQREEDCTYSRLYYRDDGQTTRPATEEEKVQEQKDAEICLNGVKEARLNAKVNDISTSLLFLFLGIGTLLAYKIFFLRKQ